MSKAKFTMFASKKDGTERRKECDGINSALHALYRVRNVVEGYVKVEIDGRQFKLVTKIGRRRGISIQLAGEVSGRPMLKKAGKGWQRLPSRFNDLT